MSYYFLKTIESDWESAEQKVTNALKEQGFGVVSRIDMQATLKNKLNVEMNPYLILGACSPKFAHQAVQLENHIGTMLPCNVVVQQTELGKVNVSAVDPVASMQAISNPNLKTMAGEVQAKLKKVIDNL